MAKIMEPTRSLDQAILEISLVGVGGRSSIVAGWRRGRSASRRQLGRRSRGGWPRSPRRGAGRGHNLVLAVVQPPELRIDPYVQGLGRLALGLVELVGGGGLGRR